MFNSIKLKDLPRIADHIVLNATSKVIVFYGEMGVGKTTLIKEIAKRIGVTEIISSPTYSIVNEYELENDKLFHFDCYRLSSEEELSFPKLSSDWVLKIWNTWFSEDYRPPYAHSSMSSSPSTLM